MPTSLIILYTVLGTLIIAAGVQPIATVNKTTKNKPKIFSAPLHRNGTTNNKEIKTMFPSSS